VCRAIHFGRVSCEEGAKFGHAVLQVRKGYSAASAIDVRGAMKPYILRGIQASLIALLLLCLPFASCTAKATAQAMGARVYLLRGLMNVFSLGLDEIGTKLQAQGIPVTVANFVSWSSLAEEAAAEYKSGKMRTIILVGHSAGATVLPDMVARLSQLGVPVKLAIGLDSTFRTKLGGQADRYINFYVASGVGEPVARTKDFRGALENVDVQSMPGVGHMSIDKNQVIQQKVISAIDAVVFRRRSSAPYKPSPQTSTERRAVSEAAASAITRD
jgi:hypothetical protein